MQDIFLEYRVLIVFLHVISGVVWVGGMIAMRYAAHQSFLNIESPQKRLEHIAYALKRLFAIVSPFVVILITTAIFMIKGYDLTQSGFSSFSHLKAGIWSIMFINPIFMLLRCNRGA